MADESRIFTRRDLLKRTGLAGAAAAFPAASLDAVGPQAAASATPAAAPVAPAVPADIVREPLEALTAAEADLLEIVCERLIPTDEHGPGAREARAVHYIDRALAGALAGNREAYRAGLAALDRYAQSSRGEPFARLPAADQNAVLTDVERGTATGFPGSSAQFFAMLRSHTWQGTFGDPYYGGNRDFVGWDLLGYPGVRTMVTADMQRLDAKTPPNHRSAYDNPMFVKAVVRRDREGEGRHGD
jgi:gluconate 2-dehydrogenase gamma chain